MGISDWSSDVCSSDLDVVRSRRFVVGMLASAYLFAAAWLVASGTRGEQVLAVVSPAPMPGVPEILEHTWGKWSMQVLLVALLAAWAFVRDLASARYFSAGAFFFLLVALNPYTVPFVADHSIGAKTYWRLTWALRSEEHTSELQSLMRISSSAFCLKIQK